MTKLFVFDLDGTLANIDHRLRFIKSDKAGYEVKPRWDLFFQACVSDTPIQWAIDLINTLYRNGRTSATTSEVLILTGRNEVVRKETEEWLKRYSVLYDYLHMRPKNNYEPSHVIKAKMLEDFLRDKDFQVQFIVEDEQKVVDNWRKLGYNVLQCNAWS